MKQKESLPRPEYPRPQMVREHWLNLNGKWEFEFDPGISGEEQGFHKSKPFSRTIIVPFCPESELSGINYKDFMTCVWYRRKFSLPGNWSGSRILLHFGAVDYKATVWLNGQCLGQHQGGHVPFTFEITDFVRRGNNVLVVRAIDDTRSFLQPTGKQCHEWASYGCFYTRTTGIWQTVWLEMVPQTYIQGFRIYPSLAQGQVTLHLKIDGPTEGLRLLVRAYASGKMVGETELPARNTLTCTIDLSEVHTWAPGSPFLYGLELRLKKGRTTCDSVKSYFGLRDIQLQDKKFLLNNKSIFQRLVLDQGYYPDGIYTAPSDEALRKDIELAQALGFNGARLHQKVFEPRFFYWADKLGYLLWGEYPDCGFWAHWNPKDLEIMLPEWLETVERDFNHPSIIGWCAFNETPTCQRANFIRGIYLVTKAMDTTRPVIDTSGCTHVETDVYDSHHYEQDPKKFKELFEPFKTSEQVWQDYPESVNRLCRHDAPYQGQPYFVSEYGGLWWNPRQRDDKGWGYGDRTKTPEEFIQRYKGLTEVLLKHPKMFGFCYTQLYDIEQEVNGLYYADRQPKFTAKEMARIKQINAQPAAIEK